MPQKPNNIPIIIAALAAIGGIALLNVMQQKNDPVILEKMQQEEQKKAAEKQQTAAKNAPPPAAPVDPSANEVAGWGPDTIQGKSGGSPQVTVGWVWTPAIQGNPSSIYSTVDAIKKALPNAAIRVVNLDAKPGAVPAGIAVGGKITMAAQPDGSLPPPQALAMALKRAG